jgi:hypothetical protein
MALAADWDWYENIAAQGDDQIFISPFLKILNSRHNQKRLIKNALAAGGLSKRFDIATSQCAA